MRASRICGRVVPGIIALGSRPYTVEIVGQDKPFVRTKHAYTMRHVRKRGVEKHVNAFQALFRGVAQQLAPDTEAGNDQDKKRQDRCSKTARSLLRIKPRKNLVRREADGDDKWIVLDRSVGYEPSKMVAEKAVRVELSVRRHRSSFEQIGV